METTDGRSRVADAMPRTRQPIGDGGGHRCRDRGRRGAARPGRDRLCRPPARAPLRVTREGEGAVTCNAGPSRQLGGEPKALHPAFTVIHRVHVHPSFPFSLRSALRSATLTLRLWRPDVRNWQILLQKSPQLVCRIKTRNNRIAANAFLNQRCALAPNLEKIFRPQMSKIVLQQYLPGGDICDTHSIGAHEQRIRDGQAKRLGGLEIDHRLILGRRLHRKVGRFLALEDAVNVSRRADTGRSPTSSAPGLK
jgi:hypothetical protein